jgi:N-methylhydantoinase A
VRSIGAGGGSIAWIDDGGMLHVGPRSAGAEPGPPCYGHGGTKATVTDAALVLGYIDPAFFLGGLMQLAPEAAEAVIVRDVAGPLGLTLDEAAAAVITVATENMVQAILDITVNQGIDPREAVLVGGGGAAGLNSVLIADVWKHRVCSFPKSAQPCQRRAP